MGHDRHCPSQDRCATASPKGPGQDQGGWEEGEGDRSSAQRCVAVLLSGRGRVSLQADSAPVGSKRSAASGPSDAPGASKRAAPPRKDAGAEAGPVVAPAATAASAPPAATAAAAHPAGATTRGGHPVLSEQASRTSGPRWSGPGSDHIVLLPQVLGRMSKELLQAACKERGLPYSAPKAQVSRVFPLAQERSLMLVAIGLFAASREDTEVAAGQRNGRMNPNCGRQKHKPRLVVDPPIFSRTVRI